MVLIVRVGLFSALPFLFLGLRLDRLLIHFSHIFFKCHNNENYATELYV